MLEGSIFITGANGYVGRNLVRHFVPRATSVCALVRSERAAKFVERLGAKAVVADINSPRLSGGLFAGCDALIHAAADTRHGHGDDFQYETNVTGTYNVFRAAQEGGAKQAVHISTEAVLLDGHAKRMIDETCRIPGAHAGSYSRTKALAERVALGFASSDFIVTAARPRFIWGRDDTSALPQLVAAAKSGKLQWVAGGLYLTSTCHIDNLCAGVEAILRKGYSGEVYFLTDGDPVVFRDFVTRLLSTQGVAAPNRSVPRWVARSTARLSDLVAKLSRGRFRGPISFQEFATLGMEVTLDIKKAVIELNYRPVISIEDGLKVSFAESKDDELRVPI